MPAPLRTTACRSCEAAIAFIRARESGRQMPVNAKPLVVITVEGETITAYTSHFATCPHAAQHRGRPA
jgi:hypothetical protein